MKYKSIAEVNEDALKQIESAHEDYKIEVFQHDCILKAILNAIFIVLFYFFIFMVTIRYCSKWAGLHFQSVYYC